MKRFTVLEGYAIETTIHLLSQLRSFLPQDPILLERSGLYCLMWLRHGTYLLRGCHLQLKSPVLHVSRVINNLIWAHFNLSTYTVCREATEEGPFTWTGNETYAAEQAHVKSEVQVGVCRLCSMQGLQIISHNCLKRDDECGKGQTYWCSPATHASILLLWKLGGRRLLMRYLRNIISGIDHVFVWRLDGCMA